MSRIVKAVNAMISNEHLISKSIRGSDSDEVFFKFNEKYCWSISRVHGGEDIRLFFYPQAKSIQELAPLPPDAFHDDLVPMVSYSSKAIGTREAQESFQELLTIVQEKLFGVNEALDDIISTDIPF